MATAVATGTDKLANLRAAVAGLDQIRWEGY